MAKTQQASEVPADEGRPIWEAAARAREDGRKIFTCEVTVSFTTGSGMGLGGKKTTTVKRWDPAYLVESIEALGWRLDRLDHVWQQTEHNTALNLAMIRGLTSAHMLFRRSEDPGS
jgi:hypothetical protein